MEGEILKDIALYTGESPGEVDRKMETVIADLKQAWLRRKGTVLDFYRGNRLYLYDIGLFNMGKGYKDRLRPLEEVGGQKVLDIGCGIGSLVFSLGSCNQVMGYEVNEVLLDFCRWRKAKHNLSGEFTDVMPALGNFDLITAVDVLEHIEWLGQYLLELGKGMKAGAMLYHYDTFEGGGGMWPMHFNYSKDISRFLEDAGFRVIHKNWAVKGDKP